MADTSNLTDFLGDIADAIRTKKSTTGEIPAANFDQEILSIETGIDTSDATAVAGDILKGKTAYNAEGKVEGTLEFTEGDVKLFSNADELNADTPTDHQLAIIYSNEVKSIKSAEPIASYTKSKTLYFPKTIICSTPVTETIKYRTYYRASLSGGTSGEQSLNPGQFNVYFRSQSQYTQVAYTSPDGITYTRTKFSCADEGMGWRDDPIFILDETNDCVILDPTVTNTFVYYRITSEDTDGSLAAILEQFFLTKQYNFESMHIAIPQEDTLLTKTATDIAIGTSYQVSMTHTLKQRSITPFLTAIELLQNYCYDNSITTSLTSVYGGLTKIKSETEFEMYIGGYITSSGTSYFTQMVYFFTPKDYTTVTPEDEIYICSGFRSSSSTPFLRAFNINTETSTVTEISLNTETYTDTSSNSTVYIPTDIDRTVEYAYVYSASATRNLSIYTLNSSGVITNYGNMSIQLGFGTSPKYIYAQNQFTVNSASQLLPEQTAFGTIAPITGDDSVYDNLEMTSVLNRFLGSDTSTLPSYYLDYNSDKSNLNKIERYKLSNELNPHNAAIPSILISELDAYNSGNTTDNGYSQSLSFCLPGQSTYTKRSYATSGSISTNDEIYFYGIANGLPKMALIQNTKQVYNAFGFIHNEEVYLACANKESAGNTLVVYKVVDNVISSTVATISATSNYYTRAICYWEGYLYFWVYGTSSSYNSGYIKRMNVDTGAVTTLRSGVKYPYTNVGRCVTYNICNGCLEIYYGLTSSPNYIVCMTKIAPDGTVTNVDYTSTFYFYEVSGTFYYNGVKYITSATQYNKNLCMVNEDTKTITKVIAYSSSYPSNPYSQPEADGLIWIHNSVIRISPSELMKEDIMSFSLHSFSYRHLYDGYNLLSYANTAHTVRAVAYELQFIQSVSMTEDADVVLILGDTLTMGYSDDTRAIALGYVGAGLAYSKGLSSVDLDTALETSAEILGGNS